MMVKSLHGTFSHQVRPTEKKNGMVNENIFWGYKTILRSMLFQLDKGLLRVIIIKNSFSKQ